MSEMGEAIFKSKKALPNKLMQEDGSITDMLGNPVTDSVAEYDSKTSLPNKWMNPDGSYSTLNEIIAGAIDTDLFIVVTELPEVGEENKIYLVPKESGTGFVEWAYIDGQWDTIGELEIDLSDYPTTEEMQQYVGNNTLTKTNTTVFTPTADYHPATKKYVDDNVKPEILYWDGNTGADGRTFWTNIVRKTNPVIIFYGLEYHTGAASHVAYISNPSEFPVGFVNKCRFNSVDLSFYTPTSYSQTVDAYVEVSLTVVSNASGRIVSEVYKNSKQNTIKYLDTDRDYSTVYTPLYDGSPATKKYVDDAISTNVTSILNANY